MQALIRATHRYAFRTGEWAAISGISMLPFRDGDRPCYLVVFPDDVADFWIVDEDPEPEDYRYGYEFLMA